MRRHLTILVVGGLLLAPVGAQAQRRDTYAPKAQILEFDPDLVEAGPSGPNGELVEAQRKLKHPSLITLRTSFRPELLRTAEGI